MLFRSRATIGLPTENDAFLEAAEGVSASGATTGAGNGATTETE